MAGWGSYSYQNVDDDDEEIDNDRADDEDFNVDEEEDDEDEGEEPEYQDDSDEADDDDEEDMDEDEQDEEDARQLRAVAQGTPLHHAAATGVKRPREDDWAPPAAQHPGAAARPPRAPSSTAAPPPKRNVVRINLRQQTAKPKYSELSDEEGEAAGEAPPQAWQPSPALFQQQAVVQQAFAQAAAPAPAAPTGQVAAAAAVQQAVGGQQWAVPDWVAHLPVAPAAAAPPAQAASQAHAASTAAPQGWQPPPKPWERPVHQVPSATTLTTAKQSSGSGAWGGGGGGGAVQNHRSTPGFYAESDDEDEQDSRARRGRRVPAVLLPEDELAALRPEAERVITHRDIEGMDPGAAADPWACRQFLVKWARSSYLHCTWETKAALSSMVGFKRVLNYIKKVEEQEARRPWLSREECELLDVAKQMEEEMVEEYKQAERVIGERLFSDGTLKFLVKWKGLPYCDATYETEGELAARGLAHHIEQFRERERRLQESRKSVDAQRRAFAAAGARAFTAQPDYLKGGTLRDYQLDGLNWMVYSWSRDCNGILADEMGLGKTVQCASMIGYLSEAQQIAGPFLVVVPLSTVPNWIREFRKWIPAVNTIVYVGDAQSREVLRAFEWETGLPPGQRQYKFDALITTYEMVIKDREVLRPIRWAYMMVDEAHRLKNDESALYRELVQWSFQSKLLVTGTPLQNNIHELWALLHFLHPDKFPDAPEFEAEYNMADPEAVSRLHATLRPHLLRRVIKDVEKSLPPKNERILRVGMTPLQRQYYKWILSRNFKELNKGARSQLSLLNIITELKKCCNHPFLFQSAEEEYRLRAGGDDDVAGRLVLTSGKMVLLDKLLRRLHATGHRVLVFSQMVRMLDIISDYMRLRGYQHQRLDGSTPAQLRHQAMEHFNAPDSRDFAFLLSTRAGGLGINLATADTVIIFDSDWNPQNDLQAMSRAHRIGQKSLVNIYRFVTSGSVEEDILERAKRKMVLDHLVIQRMDTSGRTVLGAGGGQEQAKQMFGKEEMAAILRFGAEELFHEGEEAQEQKGQAVVEEDLDAILARAEVVQDTGEAQGGRMGDLLGQFNVATFKTNEDDAAFWSRLIPEEQRPREQSQLVEEPGVRSSRLRQLDAEQLAAAVEEELPAGPGGAEFMPGGKKGKKGGGGGGKKGPKGAEPGAPLEGAHLRIDAWPEAVDGTGTLLGPPGGPRPPDFPPTLSRKDAAAFVKAARQRGVISKLDLICGDAGGAVEAAGEKARHALWFGLQRACKEAIRVLKERSGGGGGGGAGPQPGASAASAAGTGGGGTPATSGIGGGGPATSGASGGVGGGGMGGEVSSGGKGPKQPEAKLDWFGVEVKAQEMLDVLRQWRLVEKKIKELPEPLAQSLQLTAQQCPPLAQWMRAAEWGQKEDAALLLGCWRHGINAWERMCQDPDLAWLAPKLELAVADAIKSSGKDRATRERHALAMARILHPEKLPKASYLETRAYGILRQVEKVHLNPAYGRGSHGGGSKAKRPPLPPGGGGPGGGATPGRGPGGGTRISPAAAAVKHAAAHHAAGEQGDDGTRRQRDEVYRAAENLLGGEVMTLVRKIRTLQRKGGEMDAKLVVSKTRKYLSAIGDRIMEVSEGDTDLRHSIWDFVSHYTENQESGEALEALFARMKAHGGAPPAGNTQQPPAAGRGSAAEAREEGEVAPAAAAAAPPPIPAAKAELPEDGELPAAPRQGAPPVAVFALPLQQAQQAQQAQQVVEVEVQQVPPRAPQAPAAAPPAAAQAPQPEHAQPAAAPQAPLQQQPQAPAGAPPAQVDQVAAVAPQPLAAAALAAEQPAAPQVQALQQALQPAPPLPPPMQPAAALGPALAQQPVVAAAPTQPAVPAEQPLGAAVPAAAVPGAAHLAALQPSAAPQPPPAVPQTGAVSVPAPAGLQDQPPGSQA